jgi:predicted esterase
MSAQLHEGQPVLAAGKPLAEARVAMIMIHGRGASARDILSLTRDIQHPDFAYLAPQANGNTWYPYRFIEPLERNEPWLSSALGIISSLVAHVGDAGIPPERVMLLGFSQGACLALEYGARNAQRYGGVVGLSGGLIGADGTPRDYPGSLGGTPVFLGCSDVDMHIPKYRVEESAEVMKRLGGDVTMRIYPGMGHIVNEDEVTFVREMMGKI